MGRALIIIYNAFGKQYVKHSHSGAKSGNLYPGASLQTRGRVAKRRRNRSIVVGDLKDQYGFALLVFQKILDFSAKADGLAQKALIGFLLVFCISLGKFLGRQFQGLGLLDFRMGLVPKEISKDQPPYRNRKS